MRTHKMILCWQGHLPVLADLPEEEFTWEKVERFMDTVRKIGTKPKMLTAEGV